MASQETTPVHYDVTLRWSVNYDVHFLLCVYLICISMIRGLPSLILKGGGGKDLMKHTCTISLTSINCRGA